MTIIDPLVDDFAFQRAISTMGNTDKFGNYFLDEGNLRFLVAEYLRNAVDTNMTKPVSLTECAKAACYASGTMGRFDYMEHRKVAKSVLDAANVPYIDEEKK